MKKTLLLYLFTFVSFLGFSQSPKFYEKPSVEKYIYDYAGVLNNEQIESLAQTCKSIENESSSQVVVLITNEVPVDYPIDDYSIQIAKSWGIGQKNLNNGLLILICPDNRESRMEVGYGLEGILTDIKTHQLQVENFNPNFRAGDYFTGIQQCLIAIKSTISPEAREQQKLLSLQRAKEKEEFKEGVLDFFTWLLALGLIAGLVIYYIRKEQKRKKVLKEIENNAIKIEALYNERYFFLESQLQAMNGFLNSKDLLEEIKTFKYKKDIEIDNSKLENYVTLLSPAIDHLNSLTNELIKNFEIKKKIENFNENYILVFKNFDSVYNFVREVTIAMREKYDHSIWGNNFNANVLSPDFFGRMLSTIILTYNQANEHLKTNEFEKANLMIGEAEQQINKIKDFKNSLAKINLQIDEAIKYISGYKFHLQEAINVIDKTYTHSYVKAGTLKKWMEIKKTLSFKINLNTSNPIAEQKTLQNYINVTLKEYEKPALDDIAKKKRELAEEESRLKAIKDAEEATRRRNSSTSTGFGGGKSRSNSTSFGGGSFGGGGSSNKW